MNEAAEVGAMTLLSMFGATQESVGGPAATQPGCCITEGQSCDLAPCMMLVNVWTCTCALAKVAKRHLNWKES